MSTSVHAAPHSSAHAPHGATPGSHAHGGHGHVGHVVPTRLLFAVLMGLLFLTFITVVATRLDLGRLNIWIAMIIATVKAALVGLYFMHLRWDRPFNAIVLISSLAFVALFIGGSLMDTKQYQPDILPTPVSPQTP